MAVGTAAARLGAAVGAYLTASSDSAYASPTGQRYGGFPMQTLEREQAETLDESGSGGSGRPRHVDVGSVLRWSIAALMVGSAGIHFGMMGEHAGVSWTHGMFFAVVAWLQILFAGAIVFRPSRTVVLAGIALNVGILVVWVLTRTVGIAIGSDGTPDPWGTIDIIAAAFEGVAILAMLGLLIRGVARRPISAGVGIGGPAFVAIIVATLTAFAFSPAFADGSGSGGSGSANGHNHGGGAGDGGHSHAAVVGPGGLVKTAAGTIITGGITGKTPCELSGPPASVGQVGKDAEGHNHRGPLLQQALTRDQAFALSAEQSVARAVTLKYPTVATALAAGYMKSTPYVPCIGAHYTNTGLVARFDPAAPSELLYDGTTPDAKIVGLSYLVFHKGGAPEGFAGPNDVWHQHTFNGGLCINGAGVVVGAENTTPEQCTARGGHKVPLKDIWMVHDWVVPGFECSWGVFAGECPELGGRTLGTAWDPPAPGSLGALDAKATGAKATGAKKASG